MRRSALVPIGWLAAAWLAAALPCKADTMVAYVPFYNHGGVGLYQPVVGVISSGPQLVATPVVSHDRKYVTMGVQARVQHLIELRDYPVSGMTSVFPISRVAGFVGGANPAPPQARWPLDANASFPVQIQTGCGGGILNRPGMTRIAP